MYDCYKHSIARIGTADTIEPLLAAQYGGGAYAAPGLTPGDGYFVSFENSLFDGNCASEYAAAIGFAALVFFQSFSYLHPYRITSW